MQLLENASMPYLSPALCARRRLSLPRNRPGCHFRHAGHHWGALRQSSTCDLRSLAELEAFACGDPSEAHRLARPIGRSLVQYDLLDTSTRACSVGTRHGTPTRALVIEQ
jgi:hypothetical protein